MKWWWCALALAAVPALAADPVRVVIVTRSSQLLPQALERFEATHGKGLIDLHYGDGGTSPLPLAQANITLFYYGGQDVYTRNAVAVRASAKAGGRLLAIPRENADRLIGLPIDASLNQKAIDYWTNGGVENLTGLLALLYQAGGGKKEISLPAVAPLPASGLYHPQSPTPFLTLDDYLRWDAANSRLPKDAPRAAVLIYQANYKNHDLAVFDALIAELEKTGIRAVGVYGWPVHSLKQQLTTAEGQTPFDIFLANNLSFVQSDDAPFLEQLAKPVINIMTSRSTEAEWAASPQGVTADRVATLVANAERVGAIDPLVIGATELDPATKAPRTVPIAERIHMAAARAKRWIALQRKPNAEKRIAILYFNNPPGKGNIGASYLNVAPSLVAMVNQMRNEGFVVGNPMPDEKQLLAMLEGTGRNIEQWAPGELDAMLEKGHVELVSMQQYKTWFAELPKAFQDFVIKGWGKPEDSRLMTVTVNDGRKYFAIPGVRLGNVFLGPQPLRSTFDRANESMHNITVPPPHIYIAAYLWYRKTFRADAIAHLGRHGTLEFLPGKNTGQAGWDSSEVVLGDVPNPYVYIIDGGGESTIARRRSAGVMIGHLTPLSVPAGEQKDNTALRDAARNYEQTKETSPALAEQYRKAILSEAKRLKLDAQLKLDLTNFEETFARVGEFLEATEAGPIPVGVHTLGTLPRDQIQREALGEYLKAAFSPAEEKRLRPQFSKWADLVFDGAAVDLDPDYAPGLKDKIQTALADGRKWIENLRASPAMEMRGWSTVLAGKYLASASTGDPLRTPSSIPSGRNLHDFDPALIPTKAAWEMGKKLGDDMLARFKRERGHVPEKISMVLWYGETIRHQGAMESEALYLMGVEPKWNSRGIVDSFRVIPEAELGRPRIDVVFTIAGIYRDGLADKILLLDKASKLAAAAERGNNAIQRHTDEITKQLTTDGVDATLAAKLASARTFGSAPGDYGAGISKIAKQSKDAGNAAGVADVYTNFMGHAYSADLWGQQNQKAFQQHLTGNEAILHSRSTSVYGVLDNDDFFEFAGGLNVASKAANGGAAPAFYVNDVRRRGRESVEGIQTFIANELNGRYWNPKWIEEMKKGGYAGAREIIDNLENLYGWQMTSAEHMDGTFWQNSYDVYVADKHGLELEKFFEKENPHVRQMMLARMLEVDRQGVHKFSDADRARLVREYVTSVNRVGVSCSANTCGNAKLLDYVRTEAPLISGLGQMELQKYMQTVTRATTGRPASQPGSRITEVSRWQSPPAMNQPAQNRASKVQPVTGYRMEEKILSAPAQSSSDNLHPQPYGYLLLAGLVGAGIVREVGRSKTPAR